MKKLITISTGLIFFALGNISCGKKEEKTPPATETEAVENLPFYADNLLPDNIDTLNIERLGDVIEITYKAADSTSGPELDLDQPHNLVGRATTSYDINGIEITAKIDQFASVPDAYGFYSGLRPFGNGNNNLGTESFEDKNTTCFTRGELVITLTSKLSDSLRSEARILLGQEINSRISELPQAPRFFVLFPSGKMIFFTRAYYTRDYLEIPSLDQVFTNSYDIEGDTVLLFLTMDESGDKFLTLLQAVQTMGEVSDGPETIPFEEYSLSFQHPEHGHIVAGLVRSKLAGVIGYDSPQIENFFAMWIKGLK